MSETPMIVYIGGYGRSGSTVLDILLGAHPALASLGEVRYFFRHVREGRLGCSCGAAFAACPVWGRVIEEYAREGRIGEFGAYERLVFESEGWRALLGAGAGYKNLVREFYARLFAASGGRGIVDSSKTARGAALRPYILHAALGLDVRLVHVTRDPRGVVHSVVKGNNERLEAGMTGGTEFARVPRAILGWTLANGAALVSGFMLPRGRYLRVRYEDVVADAHGELRRIGAFLGCDMTGVVAALDSGALDPAHHVMGGNRLSRARGGIAIRPDVSWRREMPRIRQALIWLACAPLARAFKYPVTAERT